MASAVIDLLEDESDQRRARELGERLHAWLRRLPSEHVRDVRCIGLWAGIELHGPDARAVCHGLLERGILAKDAHATTVRLAPPLRVTADEVDLLVGELGGTIADVGAAARPGR